MVDLMIFYLFIHIIYVCIFLNTQYIYMCTVGNVRDTVDVSEVLAKYRVSSPNHRVGINYLPSTEEKSEPFYNRG